MHYFLWSESKSYFPTTPAFSTPSAIISSPRRPFSALSSKAFIYINVATHVRTVYTYAFHIPSSEAMLPPILIICVFFQIIPVHLSFSQYLFLSLSVSLFSFYFSSPYFTIFPCFVVYCFKKIFKWKHPDSILWSIFIETTEVVRLAAFGPPEPLFLSMRVSS